jgi:hypothetical protein
MSEASKNAGVAPQQPRWAVEAARVQEDLVSVLVDVDDHRRGVGWDARDGLALPRTRGDQFDVGGHVAQGDEDKPVAGPRPGVQAGVLVGLVDHAELGCAAEEVIVLRGQ